MEQPPEQRIAAALPGLAPAQRHVARFFTEHAAQLGFYSAAEIASRLDTSDATVIRTAQALGYRGLADLKRALRTEASRDLTPDGRLAATLDRSDDPRELLDHVFDVHQAALELARHQLRVPFPAAVALLDAAERMVLSGTGPSGPVTEYAAVLLGRIGRRATTITSTGISTADHALGLRRGDVLVILAYTSLNRHTAVLIDTARRRGVPVILITDMLTVTGVDLVLSCPRGLPGESSSHAVTVLLFDALAIALAAADRSRATIALRELNRLRAALLSSLTDTDTSD
jgi:DNA-binding MurR/RpiR family transcriptional regulator